PIWSPSGRKAGWRRVIMNNRPARDRCSSMAGSESKSTSNRGWKRTMGEILTERLGRVMVVTIANEAKRNALNKSMEEPFFNALVEAEQDDEIRVVVITGAGDIAFCSGHDLTEVGRRDIKLMKPDPMGYPDRMKKPVIGAVNGHCHAAGL